MSLLKVCDDICVCGGVWKTPEWCFFYGNALQSIRSGWPVKTSAWLQQWSLSGSSPSLTHQSRATTTFLNLFCTTAVLIGVLNLTFENKWYTGHIRSQSVWDLSRFQLLIGPYFIYLVASEDPSALYLMYVHTPGLFKDDFMTCEVNGCLVFLGPSSHPGLFQPRCFWPLANRSSTSLTHLNLVLKGLIVNVFKSSAGFKACAGVSGRRNRGGVSTWYECVFVLRCWKMLEWKTWGKKTKNWKNSTTGSASAFFV